MMRATILTFLLGFTATSHGWVLDSSCHSYRDVITEGMRGAFDLANAAYESFAWLPNSDNSASSVAQRDLVSYLFADALANGNIDPNNPKWQAAANKFGAVLNYDTNLGNPETAPLSYKSLKTNNLVMYCDYSRFVENYNCEGKKSRGAVCDKSIGMAYPMDDNYKSCKGGRFSTSSTEVSGSPIGCCIVSDINLE